MRAFSRLLAALSSALFVALLAPPLASAVFALVMCVTTTVPGELGHTGLGGLLLLALDFACAACPLGVCPDFVGVAAAAFACVRREAAA